MTGEFKSLDSLSRGINYVQTAIARLSGLLLMLGLVTASANLLMKDFLFGSVAPWLQHAWAVDQALAVDANLALVFSMLFAAITARNWVRTAIYSVVGALLLFVSAIIMDIESVRQALDISLDAAALQVHVTVALLTQVRSVVVVLLVATSGLSEGVLLLAPKTRAAVQSAPVATTIAESQEPIVSPGTQPRSKRVSSKKQQSSGYGAYKDYVSANGPKTVKEMAVALGVSPATVQRYRRKASSNGFQGVGFSVQQNTSLAPGMAEVLSPVGV